MWSRIHGALSRWWLVGGDQATESSICDGCQGTWEESANAANRGDSWCGDVTQGIHNQTLQIKKDNSDNDSSSNTTTTMHNRITWYGDRDCRSSSDEEVARYFSALLPFNDRLCLVLKTTSREKTKIHDIIITTATMKINNLFITINTVRTRWLEAWPVSHTAQQ